MTSLYICILWLPESDTHGFMRPHSTSQHFSEYYCRADLSMLPGCMSSFCVARVHVHVVFLCCQGACRLSMLPGCMSSFYAARVHVVFLCCQGACRLSMLPGCMSSFYASRVHVVFLCCQGAYRLQWFFYKITKVTRHTKSHWSLLSGGYAKGNKRSYTG